jgi:DNA replicative helicase MCM subunit Mcm2 (Cdc46/Mcm family)
VLQTLALMHCCRRREQDVQEGGDTAVRVKYNRLLHGARTRGAPEPLTTAFLKKFIKYAKNRYQCAPWRLQLPLRITADLSSSFLRIAARAAAELSLASFARQVGVVRTLQGAEQLCRNVELTAEAMEAIGDYYAELRGGSDSRALPITVQNCAAQHSCSLHDGQSADQPGPTLDWQ